MQRGTAMALFAMGLGVLVIANDFTALNVALPAIEQDFDVDVGTIQWTINAYALTFGMVLVTGGRLADMFGRRKIFFIGTAIFAGFSLLGGLTQNAEQLIVTRVGMGVGGGLMWPAILGMTFAAVPPSRAAFAGGMILGIAGLGNAIGPLIGGVLTDSALGWRAIFFLNLPVAAFAVAVTAARIHQPAPDDAARERIDYGGIVALSLGLVLLLLALDQSADWGWGDPRVLGMIALALVSFAAFAVVEPRMGEGALVPTSIIRNRFVAACLTILCLSAVFFTAILYVPQLMEKVLGYSALEAGLGMLPMLGTFGAVALLSDRLVSRVGMRAPILAGTALLAAGPLLLSFFGSGSGYAAMVPGLVATGIGAGLFYPTVTTAAVGMLDDSRSSLAGGIAYMFQVAGGAIGLGLVTTLFTIRSEDDVVADAASEGLRMSGDQAGVIHGVLAGTEPGQRAFADFGDSVADKVLDVVRDSFVTGVAFSLRVVAAIALVGLVIAIVGVHPKPAAAAAPESAG